VVGDVAAAVDVEQLGADGRGIHEHVRRVGLRPERVDVRVLEQQQVLVFGALVQRALQHVGLAVRDPPEPTRLQVAGHASSASQSRVSSTSRIALRNDAA
jgi:hypothetical protein